MLSEKANKIFLSKYAQIKKDGTKETWEEACWRVAFHIASAEKEYGATDEEVMILAKDFYRMVVNLMFIPGGRILANAGTQVKNLFNCFVVPVGDSRQEIYYSLYKSAEIFANGGGVGYNLSKIRERGAEVKGTGGKASGPMSFMELYDMTGEVIAQASRRGAQMGILNCDHPDIESFINYKSTPNPKNKRLISELKSALAENYFFEEEKENAQKVIEYILTDNQLTHFNISVGITDDFMRAVDEDSDWNLISRIDGSIKKTVKARDLMYKIAESAWRSGDPGVLFLDRMEAGNMVPYLGKLDATNPCAEVTLLPNEPCCLGSINLALMIEDGVLSEKKLAWVTTMAVRFLDNVHTINNTPIEEVNEAAKRTRRLGLGVMGWADLLVQLGISYDSEEAITLAEETMKSISTVGWGTSQFLAEERGTFAGYEKELIHNIAPYILNDGDVVRNVAVTSIAPTGSIALLADVNSGIEPFFALTYTRYITEGIGNVIKDQIVEVNPYVKNYFDQPSDEYKGDVDALSLIKEDGDLRNWPYEEDRNIFKTASEISWKAHIDMQAAFQKYTDNSISKCIAAGTLIQTNKGLYPIESFSDNLVEDTFFVIKEDVKTSLGDTITEHYYAGKKSATKVRLDNGAEIVGSTESHKIMTVDGWKKLSELKKGDAVVGSFSESHGAGGAEIVWQDVFNANANTLTTPKQMTVDLALFLGMIVSDGHTIEASGNVGLTTKDSFVETQFIDLCKHIFNIEPHKNVDKRNGVVTLYLTSRNLVRYIENLIGKGAWNKTVPSQILKGNMAEKLAFIRGITLDGYVTKQGLVIYEGRSKGLAYQLFELCNSFGMPKVYTGKKKVYFPYSGEVFNVRVSNNLQEIFWPLEKHKNIEAHYARYLVSIVNDLTKVDTKDKGYTNWRSLNQRKPKYCWNNVADQLNIGSNTPIYKVTKVEDAGLVDMFDIEVENSHSYVTNGILSHNTINMPNSVTINDIMDAYMYAWKAGLKSVALYRDKSKAFQILNK